MPADTPTPTGPTTEPSSALHGRQSDAHGASQPDDALCRACADLLWFESAGLAPALARDADWRAAIDLAYSAGRESARGRGICGTTLPDVPTAACSLLAGHSGWHHTNDGCDFTLGATIVPAQMAQDGPAGSGEGDPVGVGASDTQRPSEMDLAVAIRTVGGPPVLDTLEASAQRPSEAVVTWDWREYPDPAQLDEVLSALTDGRLHCAMADTGSDQYGLVIATRPLDEAAATEAYRRWWHAQIEEADRG